MSLSKEQILGAKDIVTESVPIPEWGGSVLVRSFDGTTRDEYDKELNRRTSDDGEFETRHLRSWVAVHSIVDDAGELVFSFADIAKISEKSGAALTRVWKVARRLSMLGGDGMDEAEKNLETDQS